jgi:2'-5' RNA ligase
MSKNPEFIRSFIAIDLPDEMQNNIQEIISFVSQRLRKQSIQLENAIRWVPPKNIHITLHFLGDIQKSKLEEISNQTKLLANHFSPFTLQRGGFGIFPKPECPRVIWIGVQNSQELIALHQQLSLIITNWMDMIKDHSKSYYYW